jgi:heme exporter protein D
MMMIIVIVAMAALLITFYMQRKNLVRKENEHKRNMQRFERLMRQIKQTNPEQKENNNE